MKFLGILFTVIIFSMISTVYAHPVPLNVMVQDQGLILFETELRGYGEQEQPGDIEQFSEEWISYSFIWILVGMISIIIAGSFIATYREEIFSLAQIR